MAQGYRGSASGARDFITVRAALHKTYIQETEKTKRYGYTLAAGLLALGCLIPIFAPAGRETASWFVGAALLVFAAGSMGYTYVRVKPKEHEFSLKKEALEKQEERSKP